MQIIDFVIIGGIVSFVTLVIGLLVDLIVGKFRMPFSKKDRMLLEKAASNAMFLTEDEKVLIKSLVEEASEFKGLHSDVSAPLKEMLEVLKHIENRL